MSIFEFASYGGFHFLAVTLQRLCILFHDFWFDVTYEKKKKQKQRQRVRESIFHKLRLLTGGITIYTKVSLHRK